MKPEAHLCTRCRRSLPPSAFRPIPKATTGLDSWCKQCHAERTQQWRAENREAYLAGKRDARARDRALIAAAIEAGLGRGPGT